VQWTDVHRTSGLVSQFLAADPEVPGSIPGAVVTLERDPLSLMTIIEELLGRKSSGSGLHNRD
jgi:hypothetical protein